MKATYGLYMFFMILTMHLQSEAQNVGIGTTNPSQKLDVQGNMNLSGALRANGVAGLDGQVLRSDNAGNILWGYAGRFSNFFTYSSNSAFSVPANVTTILVEAWGGGGGGATNGGGGGGGYIAALATVTPASSLPIVVGTGGQGGSSPTNGGNSTVTIGSLVITAYGGLSGSFGFSNGIYGVNQFGPPLIGYDGQNGEAGGLPTFYVVGQANSTNIFNVHWGNGGDAGNTSNTGALAGIGSGIGNISGVTDGSTIRISRSPGGGGCTNGTSTVANLYNAGADGKVLIHW